MLGDSAYLSALLLVPHLLLSAARSGHRDRFEACFAGVPTLSPPPHFLHLRRCTQTASVCLTLHSLLRGTTCKSTYSFIAPPSPLSTHLLPTAPHLSLLTQLLVSSPWLSTHNVASSLECLDPSSTLLSLPKKPQEMSLRQWIADLFSALGLALLVSQVVKADHDVVFVKLCVYV